jgi:hypothetical protein
MGVCKISVVFFKQLPNLLAGDPAEATNPASAAASYEEAARQNAAQAQAFLEAIAADPLAVVTETGVSVQGQGFTNLVAGIRNVAEKTREKLGAIASKVDAVNIAFTNTYASILSNAESLARSPVDLARQMQNLVQLPMLAVDSVKDRVSAYKDYVDSVLGFSSDDEVNIEAGNSTGRAALSVASISSLAAVSAMMYSVSTGESVTISQIRSGEAASVEGYLSRLDIISAINEVQNLAKTVSEKLSHYSALFGADMFFNQYFDYSILNKKMVAATVRNLNKRIFSAAAERMYVTEKDINIVPLTAKLYNSVNINTIQFLIDSNNLHGDMLYLVPRGTEILYY